MKRIVLAYSGDLASSIALARLGQDTDAELVTVSIDIGQGRDLAVVRERALGLGAVRAHVIDAREEFGRDYVLPALQAGAFLDGGRSGLAIARAAIASRAVEIARMEGAAAVAHGAAIGSPTAVLLGAAVRALDPSVELLTPLRSADASPTALTEAAREAGIHAPPPDDVWVDANLWTRTIGRTGEEPDEDSYLLTRSAEESPEDPAYLDLEFASGIPIRTNGVEMAFTELVESVETIAGAHGVGRMPCPDAGCVIEAPAAVVLATAHRALEAATIGADLVELKRQMSAAYVRHVLAGGWFSDAKLAIDAFVRVAQQRVNGTVRLRLVKGRCEVVEHDPPGGLGTGRPSSKAVA